MQSADCQDMSCPVALELFQCILQRYPSAGADIAPFAETATLAKNDFLLLYG